ncbi:hypothetical protein ABZZ17_24020 [Streptomyces sp. NPDC006512]|uniref:hypothetical protein n=1 Tax=Streptomyces sp. NPDC006512 TaxID=3154307 RepID=UPI0033BAEA4B
MIGQNATFAVTRSRHTLGDKQRTDLGAAPAILARRWDEISAQYAEKEGAAAPGNRFSARLIDGTDDETGGPRVNETFTLNRILDGDAFYVKITP